MAPQLLIASTVTTLVIAISILIMRRLLQNQQTTNTDTKYPSYNGHLNRPNGAPGPTNKLAKSLALALPDCVILPHDATAFKESMNAYWAQQECEVVPACVLRPGDTQQLCTAVKILRSEYNERLKRRRRWKMRPRRDTSESETEKARVEEERDEEGLGLFAIRSGGHSPISGAASLREGVVIDLSRFCEVTLAEDGRTVVIGTGARWMDVSKVLDEKGLAVVGGRSSTVGVGGLLLGGGLSYFSPRFGLACSNILSYEVVLADGSVTTASASTNPDLWRALKGGSNNFGIITRTTTSSFPCTKIWAGWLHVTAFQATKALTAFHEFVSRADPNSSNLSDSTSTAYDPNASGPILCFTYFHRVGIQVISANLVHTQPFSSENNNTQPKKSKNAWPLCWETSLFRPLDRLLLSQSTCRLRTLTDASDELNALNPAGRRQAFATTTIYNDPATLAAAHAAHQDAVVAIRKKSRTAKNVAWSFVLQPLVPEWARKGDPNPLGLGSQFYSNPEDADKPLVIVILTVNWPPSTSSNSQAEADAFIDGLARETIEKIEAFATARGTAHRYRYLNYCAEWQRPFEGYGEEGWRVLKEVSRRYDAEGMFQRGCAGGFKLGMEHDEEGEGEGEEVDSDVDSDVDLKDAQVEVVEC